MGLNIKEKMFLFFIFAELSAKRKQNEEFKRNSNELTTLFPCKSRTKQELRFLQTLLTASYFKGCLP